MTKRVIVLMLVGREHHVTNIFTNPLNKYCFFQNKEKFRLYSS
jgi:hypothetical protein